MLKRNTATTPRFTAGESQRDSWRNLDLARFKREHWKLGRSDHGDGV